MCQVTDLDLENWLPCKFREGGGRQCEREEAHGDDVPHFWSMHTVMHERAGNAWACESFKEPVAMFAYKERLKAEIKRKTEYLAELEKMPSVP